MLQTLQDDCQIKVEVKLGDEYWEYTHGVEDSDGIFSSRYEIIGQKDQEKHGEVLDNPQCLVTAARLYVAVALPVVRRWHLGTQAQDTLYTVRLTLLDQSSISEVSCKIENMPSLIDSDFLTGCARHYRAPCRFQKDRTHRRTFPISTWLFILFPYQRPTSLHRGKQLDPC